MKASVQIMDTISFKPDRNQLGECLKLYPGHRSWERVEKLLLEAEAVARPKALYLPTLVETRCSEGIRLQGLWLSSKILSAQSQGADTIFPFLATAGLELEKWAQQHTALFDRYIAELISEMACQCAVEAVFHKIDSLYELTNPSCMNPGSLRDWSIEEQVLLFNLMNGQERVIGVVLTDEYMMIPMKTMSGIRFSAETQFVNCDLCQRQICNYRRAVDIQNYSR